MDTNRPIPVSILEWIEKNKGNTYVLESNMHTTFETGFFFGACALYKYLQPAEMMEYVIDTLATNGKRLQDRVDDLEAILEQKDERIMELEKKNLHLEDLRKMLRLALLEIKQSAGQIMADDSEDFIRET